MRKTIIAALAVAMAMTSLGRVICSCESAPVKVDSRTGVEPVLCTVALPWDASWIGGDADATVVIADNGNEVRRVTGSGEFAHGLSGLGRHELTYTTYINGAAQAEVYKAYVSCGLTLSLPGENILAKSVKLSASCSVEGAELRYTTDGTTPTSDSPVFKAFTVKSAMTVTVGAFLDGELALTTQGQYWFGVVAVPEIAVEGDLTFTGNQTRQVTLSCDTEDAVIRYSLLGDEPTEDSPVYAGPFDINLAAGETVTIRARAFKTNCKPSETVETTLTREWALGDGVNAPDLAFTTAGDAGWTRDVSNGRGGGESLRSGRISDEQESWLETTVDGSGAVSFWWMTSCEETDDEGMPWDRVEFSVDGVCMAWQDGMHGWGKVSCDITGDGRHTLRWTYIKDVSDADGLDCVWLDDVEWQVAGVADAPYVEDDAVFELAGNKDDGFVVRPSYGNKNVVVIIPAGIAHEKVTVEVAPDVERVTANGAAVKVVAHGYDITPYLNIPAADASGAINLTAATVKEAFVREAMDTEKGAVIELTPENPSITTPPTRRGLTYILIEGATLQDMANGDSKVGDGAKWTPNITVKGGKSGFYSIKVQK
ncbi:MAG: chitobiase/beta-hexosaminidase C-terminal domain-containing protein [Kiritimatiellae bacterium]|nr:chitobiase/beta-hexosaminidase C-terminal domain-containing protein [Kiritimatiellia bacterium]